MTDYLQQQIDNEIFRLVGSIADEMGREAYVIGGFVRDLILRRPSSDIDFVTVGSGIELAQRVAQRLGPKAHLSVFASYGTAQVKWKDYELEFVGARRESYSRDSRNPIVEDGTLADDQARRDFTVNILALSINRDTYGHLVDPYNGLQDIADRTLRTPLDPDVTFSDDPLRMMRAIRFAAQLGFRILPETLEAIRRNAQRINIIKKERIADELCKIMRTRRPSIGFRLLDMTGLLQIIFPELAALKGVQTVDGRGHKDNFLHTLQVVDNVAARSGFEWLRWAALLHDIGKPATRKYEPGTGWTFRNHNYIGSRMVYRVFRQLRLPMNAKLRYVAKLVDLHMRPQQVGEEGVTDSAIRRLRTDATSDPGSPADLDDLAELMILAEADLTSKKPEKVRRILQTYGKVRERLIEVTAGDGERETPAIIGGHEIMEAFGIEGSNLLGEIKTAVRIKAEDECLTHSQAFDYLLQIAPQYGLTPVSGIDEVRQRWEEKDAADRQKQSERAEKDRQEKERRDAELGRQEHAALPMFGRTLL